MSDNLEKNIKQIADLLSKDDVADSLKKLLGNLIDSNESSRETEEKSEQKQSSRTVSADDMKVVEHMVRAVSELKNTENPGVNLLMSLKPFIRQTRSGTLRDCVKMLHMAKIYEYMQKSEDILNI